MAHLSANALDAAAHLDQSNVAQSFGAHDAFMSSMAASHSGDLAASGPAPKTFLNTATRSIMWGPGPCGGPCGPLGAHFSKTSLNSSAHSSLTNSNLAIAWSLVMVPASKAALMAPILVAHSSLTSAISSRHFLTHGGLGPNGGLGAGGGAWRGSVAAAGVGAPRVGTRATHASSAVALVVVPVLRGRASEEEKYEQDDGEDLPACGWEARVGFVRNLRNRALFLRSFLASSSRMFRLRGAASGGTRGGRAGVSPAGSRPNGVGGYNLKTWRETGRDAYLCGRPGGGRARGGRATVAAARVE